MVHFQVKIQAVAIRKNVSHSYKNLLLHEPFIIYTKYLLIDFDLHFINF